MVGWDPELPVSGQSWWWVDEVVEGSEGELQYFLLFQTFRGVVMEAREEHPVNGAEGVGGGQFIARLRATLVAGSMR